MRNSPRNGVHLVPQIDFSVKAPAHATPELTARRGEGGGEGQNKSTATAERASVLGSVCMGASKATVTWRLHTSLHTTHITLDRPPVSRMYVFLEM